MLEPKAILKFAGVLLVTFALLMWPWAAWEKAYRAYFRGLGNAAFSQFWFWPAGSVHFVDLRSANVFEQVDAKVPVDLPESYRGDEKFRPAGERDTLLLLQNRNTPGAVGILRTGSRGMAYWPTATLLALVVATPIAWRKKGWLLFWSLVAVHLFILVRLSVFVAANGFFDPAKNYRVASPGSFSFNLLRRRLEPVLCDNPTVSFVVPVFLWLVVLFGLYLWSSWREQAVRTPKEPRRSRRDF